jgi:hypothetical protein
MTAVITMFIIITHLQLKFVPNKLNLLSNNLPTKKIIKSAKGLKQGFRASVVSEDK